MPFVNEEFDERSTPRIRTSQISIQDWTEQSLHSLLCDPFQNKEEWMFKAKQVLWDQEATPEVSILLNSLMPNNSCLMGFTSRSMRAQSA